MAATADIEAGEPLVSLPMSATLLVTPKQRCPFPDFCSPAFYASKPWCVLKPLKSPFRAPWLLKTLVRALRPVTYS